MSDYLFGTLKKLNNKWWVNGIPTCRDRDTDTFHHEDFDNEMKAGIIGTYCIEGH